MLQKDQTLIKVKLDIESSGLVQDKLETYDITYKKLN